MQSQQNKPIIEHIHSTKKKKNEVWKFVLKLCQMKLKMCSSTYDVNRAKFVLKLCQMKQKICFSTYDVNISSVIPNCMIFQPCNV